MNEIIIKTTKKQQVVDITDEVKKVLQQSKIKEGICFLFTKHATAALTINENADPNIGIDFLEALDKLIPQGIWRHDKIDRNGAAHIKAAIIGPDIAIPIKSSELALGTWQGIMLCEFDGPRDRKIIVKIVEVKK